MRVGCAYAGKCRVGQVSSVIEQLLTGEWADGSIAGGIFGGCGIFGANKWNAEICKAVGVDVVRRHGTGAMGG